MPGFGKVAIGRPGKFRVWTAQNGYPSTGYALVTRDGNLWFSNANGQFVMPMNLPIEFWTEHDGLEFNTWSVLRAGARMYAIAGDAIRVLDKDRRRWSLFASLGEPICLAEGPKGTLLAGTLTGGVVQFSRDGRMLARSQPASVRALARAADGEIWVTGDRLARIDFEGGKLVLRATFGPDPSARGWGPQKRPGWQFVGLVWH